MMTCMLSQCSWCGRRHRPQSLIRDPDRIEYLCPEYVRGRKPVPGPWNLHLDRLMTIAIAAQPETVRRLDTSRGVPRGERWPDAARWRP
jgi:hypothetical protein